MFKMIIGELLFENDNIKSMIYVTPEGYLYELGPYIEYIYNTYTYVYIIHV